MTPPFPSPGPRRHPFPARSGTKGEGKDTTDKTFFSWWKGAAKGRSAVAGKGLPHTAQRAAVAGSQVPPNRRARSLFSGRGGRAKLLWGELRIAAYCRASPAPRRPLPRSAGHFAAGCGPRFSTADSGRSGGGSTGAARGRGSGSGAGRTREPPPVSPLQKPQPFSAGPSPRAQCRSPPGARRQRKPHLGPLNFAEPNACRSWEQTR